MTSSLIAAGIGVCLLLAVVGLFGLLASRLRTLSGRVGSFVCGTRPERSSDAWVAGIAQYGAGRLDWWRSWSLSPRPARSWRRTEFEVLGRAPLSGPGRASLYLVQCRHLDVDFELAMSPEAYAGLTSWIEAAPPSAVVRIV